MNLEGFIDFRLDLDQQISPIKTDYLIGWGRSYIKITSSRPFNSSRFKLFAGVENYKKEVIFLSNNELGNVASFFDFNAVLNSTESTLGIGIWYNIASKRLFLAREIFGMLPLFYIHIPNEFVAFSTNLIQITRMLPVQSYLALNKNRIITYCTFRNDQSINYSEDTFYNNIKSVLPGHIAEFNCSEVSSTRYVNFDPDQWRKNASNKNYGDHFKALLFNSVKKDVKNGLQLKGSHLSGGLDSSSISSLVKLIHPDQPLHTFYYSTQSGDSDDYTYAQSVVNNIGSIHHYVTQQTNDLELIQLYTSLHGYPQGAFMSPTSQGSLMRMASEIGCEVLLNGNDGDSIVGSGLELVDYLFKQKNWQLIKNLLRKRVPYFSLSNQFANWESLSFEQKNLLVEQNYVYTRLSLQARSLSLRELYILYKEVSQYFEISKGFLLKKGIRKLSHKLNSRIIPPLSILHNDLLENRHNHIPKESKLSTSLRGNLSVNYQQWFEDVYTRQAICNNEERFTLANHYGFSNRSPFYDKELFEFCMSIPALDKYGDGQGRAHFREAMKGILPEHVRVRHQKATVGPFGRTVTLRLYAQSEELLMDSKEIWEYVDKNKFQYALRFLKKDGLPNDQYNRSIFHITKTISLAVWLEWLKSNN